MRVSLAALAALATVALVASAPASIAAPSNQFIVDNQVRVTAISATLLRVEPIGPMGFEDRTTFMVQDRDGFAGLPITQLNVSADGTWLSTSAYKVLVKTDAAPNATCANAQGSTDVDWPVRTSKYPDGAKADSQESCCDMCTSDATCTGWVYAPPSASNDVPGANCWPLSGYSGTHQASGRVFGCAGPTCGSLVSTLTVATPDDHILFTQTGGAPYNGNMLHWPAPTTAQSYALTDFPRFFTPAWGPTPIPDGAKVDPALVPTNGYDFRNNVNGDQYVFLLGDTVDSWHASRREFIHLAGPTPALPDFWAGTWFTWWHSYTETEAKNDISLWESGQLPIDVWALDMNWRNTSNEQDRFYDHPATQLFPGLGGDGTEWFDYLQAHKLRTYFNDHPFPVANQTTAKEVAFRWNGLTEWMDRGLTYWWFDRNWGFSVPPPNTLPVGGWNVSHTGGVWDGLDNAAWGSHLYHTTVEVWDKTKRPASFPGPITLTKFAPPDWRPGMDPVLHQESPAHHRFPVWWTGDGVPLQGSTQSMVDSGLYDFKPFVHSDCGGDYRGDVGADLLRWTGHCVFGTVLRFHGNDHRPWTYGNQTEDAIRAYLNMRYKLVPSLISAADIATYTAFPLVVRGDFFWPEQGAAASDNNQYLHLNDTLVAPMFDPNSHSNQTTRDVWIPPGQWMDAYNGTTITGPVMGSVTQPCERIPMWHKVGGLTIITDKPGVRVDDQTWDELTLEAYPDTLASAATTVTRTLHDKHNTAYGVGPATTIAMTSAPSATMDDTTDVDVAISEATNGRSRAWVLRLHLQPGQKVVAATLDGARLPVDAAAAADDVSAVRHFAPIAEADAWSFHPLGGKGTPPPPLAGHVAEVTVPSGATARSVRVAVSNNVV